MSNANTNSMSRCYCAFRFVSGRDWIINTISSAHTYTHPPSLSIFPLNAQPSNSLIKTDLICAYNLLCKPKLSFHLSNTFCVIFFNYSTEGLYCPPLSSSLMDKMYTAHSDILHYNSFLIHKCAGSHNLHSS